MASVLCSGGEREREYNGSYIVKKKRGEEVYRVRYYNTRGCRVLLSIREKQLNIVISRYGIIMMMKKKKHKKKVN